MYKNMVFTKNNNNSLRKEITQNFKQDGQMSIELVLRILNEHLTEK